MNSLDFYLDKIGYISKNPVYLEINQERDKRTIIPEALNMEDIRLYVDTASAVSKLYKTDNICDLFNALNWGEDISKEDIKKLSSEEKNIYELYKKYVEYDLDDSIDRVYNDYCFSKKGWAFLFSLWLKGGRFSSDQEKIAFNTCNYDSILDKNIYFLTYFKLFNNNYSFIAVHGSGDLRGNYYNFLMVKDNSDYGFELGFNLFNVTINFIPDNNKIINHFKQDDLEEEYLLNIYEDYNGSVKNFLEINYPNSYASFNGDFYGYDFLSGNSSRFGFDCSDEKFYSEFYIKEINQNIDLLVD